MTNWNELDKEYEKTEPLKVEESVPDGTYEVFVNKLELSEKKDSDPMLKWDLVVLNLANPEAGKHIFKKQFITSGSMPFVRTDLETCGFDGAVSELRDPGIREGFLDICLEVKKLKKGEYNNVYFNKTINVDDLNEIKESLKGE